MTLARILAGLALATGAARQANRLRRRIPLRDAVVLVTGGSAGLGLAIARRFTSAGARVAICGRDETTLRGAAAELGGTGADARWYVCDVADREAVVAMVAAVSEDLDPVDVLVNNAGVIDLGEVTADEHDTFARMLDVMFWGPLHVTLAVLPQMRERRGGRIATITSIGGRVSAPHLVPYSCAKHAAHALSQGLRAELADDGILVTTVVPGLMHTGSHRAVQVRGGNRAEFTWFALGGASALTATSPDHAAGRIVQGVRHGDAYVLIGLDAKLATRIEGLAPGTVSRLLSIVDRALPETARQGRHREPGWALETALTRSGLTRAGRRAAGDLQRHRPEVGEPSPRADQADDAHVHGRKGTR